MFPKLLLPRASGTSIMSFFFFKIFVLILFYQFFNNNFLRFQIFLFLPRHTRYVNTFSVILLLIVTFTKNKNNVHK